MKPEQLTAWVLDEGSPEERAEIAAALEARPDLTSEVQDTRDFCQALSKELNEGDAGLTAMQRSLLLRQTASKKSADFSLRAPALARVGILRVVGMAACLALGLFLVQNLAKRIDQPSELVTVAAAIKKADAVPARQVPSFKEQTLGQVNDGYVISPEMDSRGGQVSKPMVTNAMHTEVSGRAKLADIAQREIGVRAMLIERESVALSDQSRSSEVYQSVPANSFYDTRTNPLSTFSIDVDTASYANVRRFLNEGRRPPRDAVRIGEMINYFPYNYEQPKDGKPFGVQVDVAEAPWRPQHRLARIAIQGAQMNREQVTSNLVFLVDVSGSMKDSNKLPLVKQSLQMLLEKLQDNDHVAIVTYAGESGVALESTSDKSKIRAAVDSLDAGGSTNGAGGINLAYQQAQRGFIKEGINRVILCTDGDFNVGVSSASELESLIARKAETGVFLSVLGFGSGNLKDHAMETLADKGNGNYAYIDSLSEARKVLVEQMQSTLVTIAKDVKIQVEFNPAQVASYTLIGYENRVMAKEDFNNDRKDAGEIGAGHSVTALYEIVPVSLMGRPMVDDLKYQQVEPAAKLDAASDELLTVKLRYKLPDATDSQLVEVAVKDSGKSLSESSGEFRFAAAAAGFGLLLRDGTAGTELTWDAVRQLALSGKGDDPQGYRGEFVRLIDKARGLVESR
ncbi:MAG: von Willebrand factor type A domain-containing protein [Verrucomicrobiaceae bacterium]|nr:von Willebrand factor type A domain-containing protein [Verrucomicrobiaceae bacterium]